MKKDLRVALRQTIPIMSGYLVLGFGFGVLLRAKGFGVLWAFGMSLTVYAGAMQFVAVDLLSAGVPLVVAALTALMVNARHLFYGITMLEKYKGTGLRKPYLIFALTDETYSLMCSPLPGGIENPNNYYFFVSVLDHCYWITGSVLGAVFGSVVSFNSMGLDFVLTALFLTIFTEQWLSSKNHTNAIIGVVATLICLLIFGADSFLIPSMVLITASLAVARWIRGEVAENA